GLAAGAATALPFLAPRYEEVRHPPRSRVAILRADAYGERLERDLVSGLRLFNLDIRGRTVLLKPNLVDFLPGVEINTHPVLVAELVVSMPKVKTHHWSGVTLSMKNLFGVVPGAKYGWPKNILHWRGIHQSIVDICATVPIHFVIADAIVAMEGKATGIFAA